MKFGIREITNVMMKAKSAMRLGNKVYYKDEPVLYFDSLKTSSLEGAATTVYAQGGRGNSRLIAWEGERTLTFNMEDALLSAESFAVLSGAGLIENVKIKDKDSITKLITQLVTVDLYHIDENTIFTIGESEYYKASNESIEYILPGDVLLKNITITLLNSDREKLLQYLNKYNNLSPENNDYLMDDSNWSEYSNFVNGLLSGGFIVLLFDSEDNFITSISDDGFVVKDNVKLPKDGKIIVKYGQDINVPISSFESHLQEWLYHEYEWPCIIPVISYEIDKSELITGYEHVVEKINIRPMDKTTESPLVFSLSKDTSSHVYFKHPNNFLKSGVSYNNIPGEIMPANTIILLNRNADTYVGDEWTGLAIADYYTPIYNKTVKQLTIDPDKFGGNFYLEADTLFRDTYGADHAATFIIPNCKVQSNFTMAMASSGDPSTFSFVLDAFPGYTKFDPSKKVLAALQINEKSIYEEDLEDRAGTPWAPGAENY